VTLVLYLGGARSGKSRLAVERASASGAPVTFVATGEPGDDEMAARIAAHKLERPPGWRTIEEPRDLAGALASIPGGETALVDCLTLWVAVSNEVGLGIVPANALAREYRDTLGRVNAAWAAAADEAWFVVAGKTLRLS
jgi:adenosylcobinamide kinase / adenosylcobinamide-phosphate guanylyltransferase